MLRLLLFAAAAAAAPVTRGPYFVAMTSTTAHVCWRLGDLAAGDDCRRLDGLTPGATFSYALPGAAETYRARALPAPGRPLRFAAFGDSGKATTAQFAVAGALARWNPDLVLLLGDIVYPRGADEDYDEKYFKPYRDILPRTPFFPSLGNHDYGQYRVRAAEAEKVFAGAYARIHRRPRYYSFAAGDVHFAALDDNYEGYGIAAAAPLRRGSEQWRWLDADLTASRARWKVLFMHVPLYVAAGGANHQALRDALAPLLKKHGVDLVLAGHNHSYERTRAIDGVVHMTVGTGGADTRSAGIPAPWTAKTLERHGFLAVEVDGGVMRLRFVGADGRVHDEAVLRKP